MFLVSGSWLARGDGVMLDGHGLRSTLDDLNARMVEAEGLLESATNMCGIGFVDQLTRNDEVSTGMVLLESFVAGFPYEVTI